MSQRYDIAGIMSYRHLSGTCGHLGLWQGFGQLTRHWVWVSISSLIALQGRRITGIILHRRPQCVLTAPEAVGCLFRGLRGRRCEMPTGPPRLVHKIRNASGWFLGQCSPVYAYACTCLVDQVVICGCRAMPAAD